jgi:predicted 3-demethylubiquinone-9 3-methyltransferase (glyoxalase superfamily)
MHKITPHLWYNHNAEQAVDLYLSLFEGSKIIDVARYPDGMPQAGMVMTMTFELAGQRFVALNGGPEFPFTEAFSMLVDCEDQAEVDRLWDRLTADGGQESMCGWLKDKFGLSWQIVPRRLIELMGDPDREKAARVTQAMLQMRKIDIAALEAAYHAGKSS